MLLTVPRLALVLLIGVSGSGKSTFAGRYFRKTQVLSSDGCRALVCDDESDQTATKDAFQLLRLILEMRLRRGKLTVVDATSVQAWARKSLLTVAEECGVPTVAIVLDLPQSVCAERNRARDRVVDAAVIAQQAEDLRTSLQELPGEPFVNVYILKSREEVEDAKIQLDN